ncbi:MAG: tetratricopeptide repeat protein [Patescibacteria group bacterium]|jgi:hypothetical protein
MENLIFYLLGFGILLLVFISTIQILISKKISWKRMPFDNLIVLFLTSVALSTLFSSPNKIQALLNPNFGLLMMIFMAVLYFYISHNNGTMKQWNNLTIFSSVFLSLITIVFYFQPFKNISPGFTPVGSQLDLAVLLVFFVIYEIVSFPRRRESIQSWIPVFTGMTLILNFVAIFLTIYSLVKVRTGLDLSLQLPMPPFRLSWFAALESLKNPLTALIGVGPDNFAAIFTRVKDFAYNQSPLWQFESFSVSHSAILQIITETGIFGLITFGLLIFSVFKQFVGVGRDRPVSIILFVYLIICLFAFPPSLIVWFLFFVTLGLINQTPTTDVRTIHELSLPIYIGIIAISFLLIATSGYFLGRSYASEYYFKKSADGFTNKNLREVYENQRQAIILNPFIERFHTNFAQTNFVIANNVSSKIKNNKLSEQDRQTITQAIQAGIAESKTSVSLNPQKAVNWQGLAAVYLNIINTAKDADAWTISAYQRAILADPQNPNYRVALGGVYYSQKKYDDALRFFEQAVTLKPDWANANYNLAWANFQKKNYPQAVNAMQNALKLIDPKKDKSDYEKVKKELEDFKKMLPKTK